MLKELRQNYPRISRMKSLSRIHIWFLNIDHKIESILKIMKKFPMNQTSHNLTHGTGQQTQLIEYTYIILNITKVIFSSWWIAILSGHTLKQ